METILAISIGMNIGFVASSFIRRRHVRSLWDWIRGRRPPEPTPLMRQAEGDAYFAKYRRDVEESERLWKMPPALRGYPPHSYSGSVVERSEASDGPGK